jgi:uncharacterized protein YraI
MAGMGNTPMTNNDDLLMRLESTGCDKGFPWTTMQEAAARIRELDARIKKSDEWAEQVSEKMFGVNIGTNVIVPVEPTEAMLEAAAPASLYGYEQSRKFIKQYWSAMIRAALKGEVNE